MRNRTNYINTSLPEDIKVRTKKTEYIINEKKGTVVAVLTWDVRYSANSRLSEIAWGLNHRTKLKTGRWVDRFEALTQNIMTSKGVAKAGNDDEFDLKKGKRIALARAEMAAYEAVKNELRSLRGDLSFVTDEIEVFIDREKRVRTGNKTFIKKVDAGEIQ